MKFSKFSESVNRILSNNHSHRRDMDVTIVVHSPGRIGSTPSVEVQSIQAGFDWDAGQVMIFPAQPLTTLTPEQVADITDSVRKGQSWHAYQEYKNHKEQLEKLSIELESAKNHIAELEAKPVSQTYKLTFEQWLEQQHDKIDVDCGCVSTEMLMHWIRVAYEAGNNPVTPDGWISCSERMPEKGQNVLISVNFDSSLVEPLICSARYTGSTFRRGDATIKPGNGIEQATHWMPLPEPPQESKSE
ncbi:DUF551 domain-containing protein [Escherichia coli]|nr:DUF551 domain-containing protein [Escherichia coli]EFB8489905.1 DUF551 domain-containing protein [Escherichia coli]EFB8530398.1 DUF551 domain-containing protein [Escherichia coli]EFB8545337.1 DUF551 domain-containing protein [Escherichia coli]EFB8554803.1 DUF551 domain-containing protein [Escherichia coli]